MIVDFGHLSKYIITGDSLKTTVVGGFLGSSFRTAE
jgi:hypothetical protein